MGNVVVGPPGDDEESEIDDPNLVVPFGPTHLRPRFDLEKATPRLETYPRHLNAPLQWGQSEPVEAE
jgi:hypothetical protein